MYDQWLSKSLRFIGYLNKPNQLNQLNQLFMPCALSHIALSFQQPEIYDQKQGTRGQQPACPP
jgi:hypothetical protein